MINIYGKVAILIDADNAPKIDYLEPILKISEYYGELQICRAYGDWNRDGLDRWSEIRDKRIDLIQVDQVGKNATDHHLLVELGNVR